MANEIGVTEVDATRQALIASLVLETLKQKSVLIPTVTDYSSFAVKGAKSVGVPRRDTFSAADKSENTNLTAQELTFATDTISLEKHKAIYAKLERIAGIQSSVEVQAEIIKEMAAELALQVDKDIYAELKLASAAAPDHRVAFSNSGTDDTLGKADIIGGRKLLNIQNVPMENRYLLVNPLHESELLAIDDFVTAEKYGSAQGLQIGELGRLYGFTVIMSNVVDDKNVVAYHKTAVGHAMQLTPEFKQDFELISASDEYLLHVIYGNEVLDSGKRQVLLGTAA